MPPKTKTTKRRKSAVDNISNESREGKSSADSLTQGLKGLNVPKIPSPVDIELPDAPDIPGVISPIKFTKAMLQGLAVEATAHTQAIVTATEASGSGLGYLMDPETAPELKFSSPDFPNITNTIVGVVKEDTYDAAINVSNGVYQSDPTCGFMPVCVLNFANASTAGDGWDNGSAAQEEQLCYRSTLNVTLHPRFYPMKKLGGIYSPHVIIFRESAAQNYQFLPMLKSPESLPVVSVVSIAAEKQPKITKERDKYQDPKSREHIEQQLRLTLRAAGQNQHRRLVLGAFGCGAFGHLPQEVAAAWAKILAETEFQGWFEQVIFAVFVRQASDSVNLATFIKLLDNKDI